MVQLSGFYHKLGFPRYTSELITYLLTPPTRKAKKWIARYDL